MVRQTRKKATTEINIPTIRHYFEHMEAYVHQLLSSTGTKESHYKKVQEEWKRIFQKDLPLHAAKDLYEQHEKLHSHPRKTLRRHKAHDQKGGATPLTGAPVAYGLHTQIPPYTTYLARGFQMPHWDIAQTLDPIKGQSMFPVLKGGKRKNHRRDIRRGGSAALDAIRNIANRPFLGGSPSSVGADLQAKWYGQI